MIKAISRALDDFEFYRNGRTDHKTTVWALRQLSEYISDDEFATVRLLMEK